MQNLSINGPGTATCQNIVFNTKQDKQHVPQSRKNNTNPKRGDDTALGGISAACLLRNPMATDKNTKKACPLIPAEAWCTWLKHDAPDWCTWLKHDAPDWSMMFRSEAWCFGPKHHGSVRSFGHRVLRGVGRPLNYPLISPRKIQCPKHHGSVRSFGRRVLRGVWRPLNFTP